MTTLEQIQQRTGYVYTVADWHRAVQKKAADLTDLDIALIGQFEGERKEAAALAARQKALTPDPPAVPAPVNTSRPVTKKDLKQILQKAFDSYTMALKDALKPALEKRDQQIADVKAMNGDLQSRLQQSDGALADLHAKNAALEAQVLELRADIAAATMVRDEQ